MRRRPPRSTLFPYPPLFRSRLDARGPVARAVPARVVAPLDPRRGDPAAAELGVVGVARVREVRRAAAPEEQARDRKSTRLNSSHANISYAVFCLKNKNIHN